MSSRKEFIQQHKSSDAKDYSIITYQSVSCAAFNDASNDYWSALFGINKKHLYILPLNMNDKIDGKCGWAKTLEFDEE